MGMQKAEVKIWTGDRLALGRTMHGAHEMPIVGGALCCIAKEGADRLPAA